MPGKVFKRRYGNRYPWDKWFKLRRFKLVRNKHFRYPCYVMAQMVRNAACRPQHNKSVNITIDPHNRFIVVKVSDKKESINGTTTSSGKKVKAKHITKAAVKGIKVTV